jgi:predicted RNase H-like HicB family nuclease
MKQGDKYVKLVEWSEEDNCFIGSCPELLLGGCHGSDAKKVFADLCRIVEEIVDLYEAEGKPIPLPMSGKEFVNAMQQIA